jgi:hypothetical protein
LNNKNKLDLIVLLIPRLLFPSTNYESLVTQGGSGLTGYVDFKFISLPLAIVRIDYTIVRVIEPQRLLVVLHNRISKGTYLT